MQRKQAKANVQIDNERIRVTEYSFNDNEETGFHVHQFDYIVVPQTNGQLLQDFLSNPTQSTKKH